MRSLPLATCLGACIAASACVGTNHVGDREPAAGTRFAVEVAEGAESPLYVAVVTESEPLGWLRVFRRGERVYMEPRCEIPDCGEEPAVCGAALPMVREVSGSGPGAAVEYVWDGTESTFTGADGCEGRRPAPEGEYVARFCYATRAAIEGEGVATAGVMGHLVDPTCVERSFRFPEDDEVVVEIPFVGS